MEEENDKGKKQRRYIIVPMFIMEDSELQNGEKLLFGEIASNTLKKGYCWMSNQYIANLFRVTTRTATRWLCHLKDKSYITIEVLYLADSKKVEERRLKINTSIPILAEYMQWYRHPCHEGIDTDVHPHIDTDVVDNNKGVSNIVILNDVTNIKLSTDEYQSLLDEVGAKKLDAVLGQYSNWKHKVDAHPKSDFDSLKKWLAKSQHKSKARVSSVTETGADKVTDAMLDDLPF